MTNKSKKFEDLGWANSLKIICYHKTPWAYMNLNIQNQVEDKSNLCLIYLGHWGGRREWAYEWSAITIHYFVFEYSMKDSWFLCPLFSNRVWYESHVFDLWTIIDTLELHMVQKANVLWVWTLFWCLSEIFVCVMNLWNILGHSSPPKMEH